MRNVLSDFGIASSANQRIDARGAASQPQIPENAGGPIQRTVQFVYQSYFDSTLLQKAILAQEPNEGGIVRSTLRNDPTSGYALGLHPSSQTPIAVEFKTGGLQGGSGTIVIKPGEVVYPGGKGRAFSGFKWGLPYGWLGGGLANLLIFQTPEADVQWPGNPEVMFHRVRIKIVADAASLPAIVNNWPWMFPWEKAAQGTNGIAQVGKPILALEPTRILMRLRVNVTAAPLPMRLVLRGTDHLDADSGGGIGTTDEVYENVNWPQNTYTSTSYPLTELSGGIARIGANQGGMCFTDLGSAVLTNQYVDVVRYGRL